MASNTKWLVGGGVVIGVAGIIIVAGKIQKLKKELKQEHGNMVCPPIFDEKMLTSETKEEIDSLLEWRFKSSIQAIIRIGDRVVNASRIVPRPLKDGFLCAIPSLFTVVECKQILDEIVPKRWKKGVNGTSHSDPIISIWYHCGGHKYFKSSEYLKDSVCESILDLIRKRISLLYKNCNFDYQFKRYRTGSIGIAHHNDIVPHTALVYLNDSDGGETVFPRMNVAFKPMCGTAVCFQSAKDPHVARELTTGECNPNLV